MKIEGILRWNGWRLVGVFLLGALVFSTLFRGPSVQDVKDAEERGRSEERVKNLEEDNRQKDVEISALKGANAARRENVVRLEQVDSLLLLRLRAINTVKSVNEKALKNIDARYLDIDREQLRREVAEY